MSERKRTRTSVWFRIVLGFIVAASAPVMLVGLDLFRYSPLLRAAFVAGIVLTALVAIYRPFVAAYFTWWLSYLGLPGKGRWIARMRRIRELRAAGKSEKEIAEDVGRTEVARLALLNRK